MSAIEILAVIGVIGYVVKDGKVFTVSGGTGGDTRPRHARP